MDDQQQVPSVDAVVKIKRSRPRINSLKIDKETIAERVVKFYTDDQTDRAWDIDARLQRYAKYRMWQEEKDWPWEGSTNAAVPDLMTAAMRVHDTIHNAVMSQRPPVMAKATKKGDREKESTIDDLIDYQIFEEQPGEEEIGVLVHDFVNEGLFTAYVPWVKESRHVVDVFVLPELPPDQMPQDYFAQYLEGKYQRAQMEPSEDGWDWKVTPEDEVGKPKPKQHRASFYTKDTGEIEVEIEHEAIRYDGPRIMPKDIQDVGHPARCENLQIPGPSNPMGASHVWLRDYPSIDELTRLWKSGYYDLMTEEDADKLGLARMDRQYQQRDEQKDIMQGHSDVRDKPKEAKSHEKLTRLMVFDSLDADGDGLDEDVIIWVILETKTVLKVKYLTEMFPSNPPERPLAEAHLFPVPGRRYSIGMLEMQEGIHDLIKQFLDQGGDAGTIANAPFFFYRASSNMRPEVIRMWPGEGYPLADPKNDVNFPQMGNQNQSFMFNMIGLLNQMEEKLTNIGELQLGRVPQGKASALRTVQGMQTVLSQGDARPERVLRRFFIGLSQIWRIAHNHNQAFLPKNKQYMISGHKEPQHDPYRTIDRADKIAGAFRFKFSANALNTSRDAMKSALQEFLGMAVSQLAITLGITKADGFYRGLRDYGRACGIDPDKYIVPPSQGAMEPPILVEEAIDLLMQGMMPTGSPAEGAAEHLQKMQAFMNEDMATVSHPDFGPIEVSAFGLMDQQHLSLFRAYYEKVAQMAIADQQQQALLQAAQQFQDGSQQPGKSGPVAGPQAPQELTQVHGQELMDESLPGAGGGANPVAA